MKLNESILKNLTEDTSNYTELYNKLEKGEIKAVDALKAMPEKYSKAGFLAIDRWDTLKEVLEHGINEGYIKGDIKNSIEAIEKAIYEYVNNVTMQNLHYLTNNEE